VLFAAIRKGSRKPEIVPVISAMVTQPSPRQFLNDPIGVIDLGERLAERADRDRVTSAPPADITTTSLFPQP
jgi:hypothetical protein